MRRLRALWAWSRRPEIQRGMRVALVGVGANALRALLIESHQRLEALEERGLVPIDDLATVGDLVRMEDKFREVIAAHAGVAPAPEPAEADPNTQFVDGTDNA